MSLIVSIECLCDVQHTSAKITMIRMVLVSKSARPRALPKIDRPSRVSCKGHALRPMIQADYLHYSNFGHVQPQLGDFY